MDDSGIRDYCRNVCHGECCERATGKRCRQKHCLDKAPCVTFICLAMRDVLRSVIGKRADQIERFHRDVVEHVFLVSGKDPFFSKSIAVDDTDILKTYFPTIFDDEIDRIANILSVE